MNKRVRIFTPLGNIEFEKGKDGVEDILIIDDNVNIIGLKGITVFSMMPYEFTEYEKEK